MQATPLLPEAQPVADKVESRMNSHGFETVEMKTDETIARPAVIKYRTNIKSFLNPTALF